jgi:hypothetical protein
MHVSTYGPKCWGRDELNAKLAARSSIRWPDCTALYAVYIAVLTAAVSNATAAATPGALGRSSKLSWSESNQDEVQIWKDDEYLRCWTMAEV